MQVLGKYLRLPGLRFDTEPVPSMLVRLGSDSDQVAQAAIDAAKVMLQQSFQIIAALVVMLWTSWQVTLAVLVLAPPLAWVMDKVGKRYRRISHRIQESIGAPDAGGRPGAEQPAGSEGLWRAGRSNSTATPRMADNAPAG